MENYINRSLFDKNMKFGIVAHVVKDPTNNISYDAKLKRSKMCYLGVKSKNSAQKIVRNWKIFVVSIFADIPV